MTDYAVFSFQLDLLIRLIDTTTGRLIPERNVSFFRDGVPVRGKGKGPGQYIWINQGREDFTLTVRAAGYEEKSQMVSYHTLDRHLPAVDLHLIPDGTSGAAMACHTLEGNLAGISALDAVRNANNPCHVREFDERKRILTVFNPHRLEMDRVFYALIHPEEGIYERFEITKRISDQEYKIGKRLEREFESHFPISRVVFGAVYPDGRYLLRVPNDSGDSKWLVRFEIDGAEQFRTVDFQKPETMKLRKEAI